MKKDIQDQFDAAFAAREKRETQRRQVKVATETTEAAFVRTFNDRCEKSFKPVLERLAAYQETKGLTARVTQADEHNGRDGRTDRDARLSLGFVMGDSGSRTATYEQPHLELVCQKHKQLVMLHQSTMRPGHGGASSSIGEFKLEQLTEEFLQQKVLALVQEILR